jgi:hypothetical protein
MANEFYNNSSYNNDSYSYNIDSNISDNNNNGYYHIYSNSFSDNNYSFSYIDLKENDLNLWVNDEWEKVISISPEEKEIGFVEIPIICEDEKTTYNFKAIIEENERYGPFLSLNSKDVFFNKDNELRCFDPEKNIIKKSFWELLDI